MEARAKAVDDIVDNNTFTHLMMATSAHFSYVDLYRQLLSNHCTCFKERILSLLIYYLYWDADIGKLQNYLSQ